MNILASTIPGIRDARGPLIAGYLWLLFAWIVIDPRTPLSANISGVAGEIVRLAAAAGPVPTAVGVSVLAYFIGVLSSAAPTGARSLWRFSRKPPRVFREVGMPVDMDPPTVPGGPQRVRYGPTTDAIQRIFDELPVTFDSLDDLSERLRRRWLSTAPSKHQHDEVHAVLERARRLPAELRRDLSLPRTLLLGDRPEVFAEADRASSEAEFRLAAVAPLIAMVCAAALRGNTWWFCALLAPAGLLLAGAAKQREASQFVRSAIEYQKEPPPAIDRFLRFVDEQLKADDRGPDTDQSGTAVRGTG